MTIRYFVRSEHDMLDITRRRLLGGAAAAVGSSVLAACGRDETGSGSDSGAGASTATISNDFGTYEIPLNPERVLLMENRLELEVALALGLRPHAVGYYYEFEGGPAAWVAPWVPFTPSGKERTFENAEVSTEKLLVLEPDLILSNAHWLPEGAWEGHSYVDLSPAAPVIPIGLAGSWRKDLEQVAGWLQREEELGALLREFDGLRDEIIDRHGAVIADATVTCGSAEDPFLWFANENAAGLPAATALAELGGTPMRFEDEKAQREGWLEASEERLDLIGGADAALFWAPDDASRNRLLSSPLWPRQDVVKEGRVVVSEQNVGSGQVYTIMECLRLWDDVYSTLS